jgi:hypothetical protein
MSSLETTAQVPAAIEAVPAAVIVEQQKPGN